MLAAEQRTASALLRDDEFASSLRFTEGWDSGPWMTYSFDLVVVILHHIMGLSIGDS